MFEEINQGPLWIFSADRQMSEVERNTLTSNLNHFISSWEAHGQPVHATYEIVDHTVVIIAADGQKSEVTGCSKDKLTHFFNDLGKVISIDFFKRMLIPVFSNHNIQLVHWNDIENAVAQGTLSADQLFVDATVASVQQFKSKGFSKLSELLVTL